MKTKEFIQGFLRTGTKESSMRLSLIWSMILSTLSFLTISFYIIFNTINILEIDWSGMAIYMGGLTAYMGAVIYGKLRQYDKEHNGNTTSESTDNQPSETPIEK